MDTDLLAIPHAGGIEKSVLSCIAQFPGMRDECPSLTPDHFYLPSNRIFFETMDEQIKNGGGTDLIELVQTLNNRGLLQRAGGPSAVTEIYTYSPSHLGFHRHVEQLNFYLGRRMAITAAQAMIETAYNCDTPSEMAETINAPITEVSDILSNNHKVASKAELLRNLLNDFNALVEGRQTPMGMPVSIDEINQMFNGLHPQQTTVISGYPSGGKTTLARQFACDVAAAGKNVFIKSLEMPGHKFASAMAAYLANVPGTAITDPRLYAQIKYNTDGVTKHHLGKVREGILKLKDLDIEIDDKSGCDVYQICASIRREHRKKPLDLVVVDYAQLIKATPDMRRESREQQLSHASHELEACRKELGFHLILLSQLNNDGDAKHAKSINEDADTHLTIKQDKETKEHQGISIQKDRHHGHTGGFISAYLHGEMLRFTNYNPNQIQEDGK